MLATKRCTDPDYIHTEERNNPPRWLWGITCALISLLLVIIGYLSATAISSVKEDVKLKADKAIVDVQIQNVNAQITDLKSDVGDMRKDIKQILTITLENKKTAKIDKSEKDERKNWSK